MSKTIRQKIFKFVEELTYSGVDAATMDEYAKYLLSLATLSDKVDGYYKKGADGEYPKLGSKEIRELQAEYNKVILDGATFLEKARRDSHKKAFAYVVGKVNDTLAVELVELSDIPNGGETTIKALEEKVKSVHVDITGQDVSFEGGNQSVRMPMTYKTSNGQAVSGYFSANTRSNRSRDIVAIVDKYAGDNTLYEEAFIEILNTPTVRNSYLYTSKRDKYKEMLDVMSHLETKEDFQNLFVWELEQISTDEKDYTSLNKDPEFSIRFMQLIKEVKSATTKSGILRYNAGVKEGSVLEERNAAMTAVADLLGTPNIIARSIKMTVKKDGKEIPGVFMEKAIGYDCTKISPNNPVVTLAEPNLTTRISPDAKKQLADLQVLDFICGNVDRHLGNVTYVLDDADLPNITGIQGIDNDCSFGVLTMENMLNGRNCLRGLKQLNRMSKSMADHIKIISPEMMRATLRPFALSAEQVEACVDRLKLVQDVIARRVKYCSNFTIVPDENFGQIEIDYRHERTYIRAVGNSLGKCIKEDLDKYKKDVAFNKRLAAIDSRLQQKDLPMEDRPQMVMPEGGSYNVEVDEIFEADKNKLFDVELLSKKLELVRKLVRWGSKEFDKVDEVFREVAELETLVTSKQTPELLRQLKTKYEELSKVTNVYLKKKAKEEKELLIKGKAPSKRAVVRTNYAQEVQDFVQRRFLVINNKLNNREGFVADVQYKLQSNIDAAKDLKKSLKDKPANQAVNELEEYLKHTISTNSAYLKMIESKGDKLSEHQLSKMVSATKQEKMIEKAQKLSEEPKKEEVEEKTEEKVNNVNVKEDGKQEVNEKLEGVKVDVAHM